MGQTYQSIVINAPADKIWKTIRSFHDVSWAPNVITDVESVGNVGPTEKGAKRILNKAFHETLIELRDADRTIVYSIDDGPPPVSKDDISGYRGRVVVRPVTEGTGSFVEWSSSWQKNDQAAAEFCHPIYVALLNDMKKTLEA